MGFLSQVRTLFPCVQPTKYLFNHTIVLVVCFSLTAFGGENETITSRAFLKADSRLYKSFPKSPDTHAAFLAAILDRTPNMYVRVFERAGQVVGFSVEEVTRRERRLLGFTSELPRKALFHAVSEARKSAHQQKTPSRELTYMGTGPWITDLEHLQVPKSPILWSFPIDPANEIIALRYPDKHVQDFSIWRKGIEDDTMNPDPTKINLDSKNDLGYIYIGHDSDLIKITAINLKDESVTQALEKLLLRDLLYRSRMNDLPVNVNPYHNLNLHNFFKLRNTCGYQHEKLADNTIP